MSLKQFSNSIRSIWRNPHIHRGKAIVRHAHWQWKKAWNLFPLEQTISQSRITVPHKSCGVGALINSQELYNYNNMKLIQWLLRGGGVFFDVGANIGSFTLLASELSNVKVFSFEPHPITFQTLQGNVALNHRTNVVLLNVALGNDDGEAFLTNVPGGAMNHIQESSAGNGIAIACARGRSICDAYQVVPQYMKLDVEGFEYDVLAGFEEQLAGVEVLFIEMNGLSNLRSQGQHAIHDLLSHHRLLGPFMCDFNRRTLSREITTNFTEDHLYAASSTLSRLRRMGWHVP